MGKTRFIKFARKMERVGTQHKLIFGSKAFPHRALRPLAVVATVQYCDIMECAGGGPHRLLPKAAAASPFKQQLLFPLIVLFAACATGTLSTLIAPGTS